MFCGMWNYYSKNSVCEYAQKQDTFLSIVLKSRLSSENIEKFHFVTNDDFKCYKEHLSILRARNAIVLTFKQCYDDDNKSTEVQKIQEESS